MWPASWQVLYSAVSCVCQNSPSGVGPPWVSRKSGAGRGGVSPEAIGYNANSGAGWCQRYYTMLSPKLYFI